MTQTPASGPLVPVTTPPMSLACTRTCAPAAGCADADVIGAAQSKAAKLALSMPVMAVFVLISFPSPVACAQELHVEAGCIPYLPGEHEAAHCANGMIIRQPAAWARP